MANITRLYVQLTLKPRVLSSSFTDHAQPSAIKFDHVIRDKETCGAGVAPSLIIYGVEYYVSMCNPTLPGRCGKRAGIKVNRSLDFCIVVVILPRRKRGRV